MKTQDPFIEVGRTQYIGHTSIKPEKSDSEYDGQAEKWLEQTDSHLEIRLDRTDRYFPDDKDERDIYEVTLKRGRTSYTFEFGQSLRYSQQPAPPYHESIRERLTRAAKRYQPSAYSILACLDGYRPGTFEDWCADLGYDTDSRKAEKTWRACVDQYMELAGMYSPDELEALNEIS